MSLQSAPAFEIPEETRRVACAAFPRGVFCLTIADAVGPLYTDARFADLFPRRGQPAEAPGRLAWVTVLQFVENLCDRAAADAVRGRLDWKYLLGLELTDPGFDHTVLSEFRARLTTGQAEQRLLDTLLVQLQELGLLKARGRQRTDSTPILAAVRTLNRLERVGETLRAALNALASVVPDWLCDGALVWRSGHELSALAERIESPYDPQARYSTKRSVDWVGYKVHFTETCDPETAHVIVNVETTVASVPDAHLLTTVHASLVRRELLPAEHLVDMGYTSPRVLVESARRDGVRIVGPIAEDTSWQARADHGFAKADFRIDWDAQIVACPAGHQSHAWVPKTGVPGIVAEARFSPQDCVPCPHREDCTKSKKTCRVIPLQPQDQYEALQSARLAQTTEPFRDAYAARAGVESTHEQAVRRCGRRRCRYIGLAKTRLQHVVTAVAVNLIRIGDWLTGTPLAPTRRSRFSALQAAA
jgi:transposase